MSILAKSKRLAGRLATYIQLVQHGAKGRGLWAYLRHMDSLLTYIEVKQGGNNSFALSMSVDNMDRPLPWITYPAIEFISQLDCSGWTVFEYGSGNSSRFWASRCQHITSVENKPQWHELAVANKLPNQSIHLCPTPEEYVNAIHLNDCQYDIIIVDGHFRLDCAQQALQRVSNQGMIILDNADWYPRATQLLAASGMLQIDFMGATPINDYASCTTFFLQRDIKLARKHDHDRIKVIGGIAEVSYDDTFVSERQ